MTLDQIFAEMQEDLKYDPTELGREALRVAELFQKYLRKYSEAKLRVELMRNKMTSLIASRRKYYSGDGTPEQYKENPFGLKIKTENEMRQYLENDSLIAQENARILVEEQKVEIYQQCLDQIKKQRGFEIKNAIEDMKFKGGLY